MDPRSVHFSMRSRKISNVGQSLDGGPKIISSFSVLRKARYSVVFAVVSFHQSAMSPRGGLLARSPCVYTRKARAPAGGTLIG
jgi:hypothetical protein